MSKKQAPGKPSRAQQKQLQKARKKKRGMKIKLVLEILLLILAILFGLYYFVFSKMQNQKLDKKNIETNQGLDDSNMKGYRNIALFGVDSQTNELGKGNRSDSIIVASINKKTKDVKLMSIYRDTYVNVDRESGSELTKITHAYSFGGPDLAVKTINQNLDLDISDYVTVNFKAVADVVDLLGGVTIDVQEQELKNLNDYIGNMNKINGGKSPKLTKGGKQTLDGNQAVAYSRIRYVGNGDFRRTERQRAVVEQIFVKAKKANPVTLVKIVNQVFPKIMTSLSSGEILMLAKDILSYEIADSTGFPFDTTGAKLSGIYYGIPKTLKSNVIEAHKYLFEIEEYEPTKTVTDISNQIINRTGIQ